MTQPYLSVVIPAYNEEARIASTVNEMVDYLNVWSTEAPDSVGERSWELIVVSDGSTDSTASIVLEISASNERVRLIDAPHGGKGAAVRQGMELATGEWRFLCDADLSMPADNLGRFFGGSGSDSGNGQPLFDVAIGSREAKGAQRFNEPRSRHIKGRLFNYAVKVLAIRGVEDTQCGFKLFSAESAKKLFPHQSLDGWAFDVELLVMAKNAGFTIGEVPIDWYYGEGSKMTFSNGVLAVVDVARVGLNNLFRKYRVVERKEGS